MKYAVTNVYDWIGFHIADSLLTSGKEVVGAGVAETERQEYLEMFFGRNAAFHPVKQLEQPLHYKAIFTVGDLKSRCVCFDCETRQFEIGKGSAQASETESVIHTPMIIGKWMPMNDEGVFEGDEFIPFSSEKFQNSISIHSLTLCLLQLLDTSKLPSILMLHSKGSAVRVSENEQPFFTISGQDGKEKKRQLLEHYRKHPDFYQQEK